MCTKSNYERLNVRRCIYFRTLIANRLHIFGSSEQDGGGCCQKRMGEVEGKCGCPQKNAKFKRINLKKCLLIDDNLQITV